jgi:hypothetical protein
LNFPQIDATRWQAHFVFVDESALLLIPTLRRTWAPRGEPGEAELRAEGNEAVVRIFEGFGEIRPQQELARRDARPVEDLQQRAGVGLTDQRDGRRGLHGGSLRVGNETEKVYAVRLDPARNGKRCFWSETAGR